jgi:competence protein ComEC
MGSILILAQLFYQKSSAVHALFLAALGMLLWNPYSILNVGFHLSFLATFLLLIMPNFKKIPEYTTTNFWIFFGISPYIMYLSGKISVAGIFSNILILFIVPVFMLFSAISIFLHSFSIHILVDVLFLEICSRYIFAIVSILQHISFLQINTPPQFIVVVYVGLISFYLFFQNRYTTKEFIEKHYQRFVPQKPN